MHLRPAAHAQERLKPVRGAVWAHQIGLFYVIHGAAQRLLRLPTCSHRPCEEDGAAQMCAGRLSVCLLRKADVGRRRSSSVNISPLVRLRKAIVCGRRFLHAVTACCTGTPTWATPGIAGSDGGGVAGIRRKFQLISRRSITTASHARRALRPARRSVRLQCGLRIRGRAAATCALVIPYIMLGSFIVESGAAKHSMMMWRARKTHTLVIPYIVLGSLIVESGVASRGVVAPNTAIVDGEYTRRLCIAASSRTFCDDRQGKPTATLTCDDRARETMPVGCASPRADSHADVRRE